MIALELILGVDNVIFISILAGKLPAQQQARARSTGLAAAVISRILLLISLSWVIQLTEPLFEILGFHISGRDLILIGGGLFLITKATQEIHQKLEGIEGHASVKIKATFTSVIFQVMILDVVFSLDSVITAVGMVDQLAIMIAAVVIAAAVMIIRLRPAEPFRGEPPDHQDAGAVIPPLIGFTLIVEGLHQHIPRAISISPWYFRYLWKC